MSERPIRVLCVDDHAFLGEGLKARLDVEPDMEFVGHLTSGRDIVGHVQRSRADIVLLDIEMPDTDAFEVMGELKRRCPATKVILLSAFVRDRYIDSALRLGAWGYLSKGDSPDDVIEGVRKVTGGQAAFCDEVLTRLQPTPGGGRAGNGRRPAASRRQALTEREEQVLRLIAKGLSRTEIAQTLHRSPMTIDNHRKAIMRKLDVRDRVELVRYAIAEGLGELGQS